MTTAEKLVTVAKNVPKVYEAGKKAEYDAFWDVYQQNGERVNYHTGFAGQGWNEHTFKPKYDIRPTNAYMLFYLIPEDANIDLVKTAEEQGIELDFSNCMNFAYFAYSSGVVRLGVIDTRRANGFSQFAGANNSLHTIEKLILKDDGSQTVSNAAWFLPNSIVNIIIEGKLGYTARSSSSYMTKASIESIINALYEGSEGQTLTLSRTAVGRAFQSSEGAYDGISSDEWKALVESKPNWTISLV
jgi:hypothetical protein